MNHRTHHHHCPQAPPTTTSPPQIIHSIANYINDDESSLHNSHDDFATTSSELSTSATPRDLTRCASPETPPDRIRVTSSYKSRQGANNTNSGSNTRHNSKIEAIHRAPSQAAGVRILRSDSYNSATVNKFYISSPVDATTTTTAKMDSMNAGDSTTKSSYARYGMMHGQYSGTSRQSSGCEDANNYKDNDKKDENVVGRSSPTNTTATSQPVFQFESLSPKHAALWDHANESAREMGLRERLERGFGVNGGGEEFAVVVGNGMEIGGDRSNAGKVQDELDSTGELSLLLGDNREEKKESGSNHYGNNNSKVLPNANDGVSSEASSLPPYNSLQHSTKQQQLQQNQHNHWDKIDMLLDDHLKEIDNHDFGQESLQERNLGLGGRSVALVQKDVQGNGQQQFQMQQRLQPHYQHYQQKQFHGSDTMANDVTTATEHSSPTANNMAPFITFSDQSTIHSSPGWSAANQVYPSTNPSANGDGGIKLSSTVVSHTTNNTPALFPSSLNQRSSQYSVNSNNRSLGVLALHPKTSFTPKSAPPVSNTSRLDTSSKEMSELRTKLRSLEVQLEQTSTTNQSLQNAVQFDQERINQLESLEEEARQEAALWEARWRDDFGDDVGGEGYVLEQLRGALLQKSKAESETLKKDLTALRRQMDEAKESYAVEVNLLITENEALREEVGRLADGVIGSVGEAISPSKSVHDYSFQSDALVRLDRMAKTSRQSEQKWSAKVTAAESKLDELRREAQVLESRNKALTDEITSIKSRADQLERRGNNSEQELAKYKEEVDRLTNEKSTLVGELKRCRESMEKSKSDFESMQRDYEQQLEAQRELHQAELKRVATEAEKIANSTTLPKGGQDAEAALAQLAQENVSLQEENASVSAENVRLSKQSVKLERAINVAKSDANEVFQSLQRAETRIAGLNAEKASLEERLRTLESNHSDVVSENDNLQHNLDQIRAEKDTILERLRALQVEKDDANAELSALRKEIEILKSQKASLEEYHINAQQELTSWQRAKEEVESELAAANEEKESLKANNLAMNERLEERQAFLDNLRNEENKGPLTEENRLLRSSLSGLEHQLRGMEASLSSERQTLAKTEHAREQAESTIMELESQIKSLKSEISSANKVTTNERSGHLRLQHDMEEMKQMVVSLREEISSAAIAMSHLELELKQREDECEALRKQLSPVQEEKYRLQLDIAALTDEIQSLKKRAPSTGSDAEYNNATPNSLVKTLEEKNHALAECIASIQNDLVTFQSSNAKSVSFTPQRAMRESSLKSNASKIPRNMMEQLSRAKAAVKETSSTIKAQREQLFGEAVEEVDGQEQFPQPHFTPVSSQVQTPNVVALNSTELSTAMYNNASPQQQFQTINLADAPTPSSQEINLQTLEEHHSAEKTMLKTKYRERIRNMKKEWEVERKTILGLISSGTPVFADQHNTPHASNVKPASISVPNINDIGDAMSVDSSYLETETFVTNILNELDQEMF